MSLIQRLCAPVRHHLSWLAARSFSSQCTTQNQGLVQHISCCKANSTASMLSRCIIQHQTAGVATTGSLLARCMTTLACMHRSGPRWKKKKTRAPVLDGCPQKRGVVLKVMIKKPKKPNSANRKCVRVRLTNGKEATAYVPGEGHNLQEHSIVLVRGGRLQDVPGVKLKCVRGKYDLAHVKKKTA